MQKNWRILEHTLAGSLVKQLDVLFSLSLKEPSGNTSSPINIGTKEISYVLCIWWLPLHTPWKTAQVLCALLSPWSRDKVPSSILCNGQQAKTTSIALSGVMHSIDSKAYCKNAKGIFTHTSAWLSKVCKWKCVAYLLVVALHRVSLYADQERKHHHRQSNGQP